MIIWAGTSSDEVGIIVEHLPSILVPKKSQEIQVVPGRNGNIVMEDGSFEDYEQPYSVFLDAKEIGGIQRVMPRVVDWLLGHDGYQRLEDTYFPDVYRKAYYSGGAEFLNIFGEYGEGTLTFVCGPEKFYKFGDHPITLTSGSSLFNPSVFQAKPLIIFDMAALDGTGSITVNDKTVNIVANDDEVYAQIPVTMAIDVKLHKLYDYDRNVVFSRRFSGNFEDLALGKKSTISWTGDIQNVRITPRWWTI